jgi:hypothetical protein
MLNFKNLSRAEQQAFKLKLIEQCTSDPELTAVLIQCAAYVCVMVANAERELWMTKCGREFDNVQAQMRRIRGGA